HLHGRVAGADHAVEGRLHLGTHPVGELRDLLAAGAGGAGGAVVGGEHLAGGVRDGDVVGVEALDAGGDEVDDRLHLVVAEGVADAGTHQHRSGGRVLLVGEDL